MVSLRHVLLVLLLVLPGLGAGAFLLGRASVEANAAPEAETARSAPALREALARLQTAYAVDQAAFRALQQDYAELQEQLLVLDRELTLYREVIDVGAVSHIRILDMTLQRGAAARTWQFELSLMRSSRDTEAVNGEMTLTAYGWNEGQSELRSERLVERAQTYRLRDYQQLQGTFTLPPDFRPERVEVVLKSPAGGRVSRVFDWEHLAQNAQAISAEPRVGYNGASDS